ncbi:DctP family TRAP transporter solute-binding subunit [Bacillus sp. Marseille-P3661]|uniref:DctP family TRAP transporter solute-binding subunit n=1 Tax=Bacillus sp. Marseille-P3661 TaxID=1936234 RepID=UPI000C819007|nr:DctP family TRAP transporter solute-binding subunit [Bacillus sp. Marseille-P3661]
MKLKKWLSFLLVSVLAFTLVACSSSNQTSDSAGSESNEGESSEGATETYDLKMSTTTSDTSAWAQGARKFAEIVSEKTDGRINIEVFPNEQLSGGDQGKGVEMLIKGTTDLSYHSTIIYSIIDERFGIVSAPFLYKNLEEADASLAGAGGEALNNLLLEKGVQPLGYGENGFRQMTNSVRPIQSPEDMEGLKMRIPGIKMYIDLFSALGADPTTMAFSEVFTALQQGTIDGQENPIDVIHSSKLNEVQNYITISNYSYDPLVLGMNKKLFDSMHPDDQKVIQEAAVVANEYQKQLTREAEAKQIEELKAAGMEFYTPTEEEMAAFKAAVEPVYEKYESVWGTDLLNAFRPSN